MARIILEGGDGSKLPRRIGNIFIRQTASGPVAYLRHVAKHKVHPRQQRQMDKFKLAAEYASAINNDPETKKRYAANLEEGETVYRKAIKEYLNRREEDDL